MLIVLTRASVVQQIAEGSGSGSGFGADATRYLKQRVQRRELAQTDFREKLG